MKRIFLLSIWIILSFYSFAQTEEEEVSQEQVDSMSANLDKQLESDTLSAVEQTDTIGMRGICFLKYSPTQLYQNKVTFGCEYFFAPAFSAELRMGVGSLNLNKNILFNRLIAEPEICLRRNLKYGMYRGKGARFVRQLGFRFSYLYGEYRDSKVFQPIVHDNGSSIKYELATGLFRALTASVVYTEKVCLYKRLFVEGNVGAGMRNYTNKCTYTAYFENGVMTQHAFLNYPYTTIREKVHFWSYLDVSLVWMLRGKLAGK